LLIDRGRHAEVDAITEPTDWTPVDRAREHGRGVILATAHIGPKGVLERAIRGRYPSAMFLARERATVADASPAELAVSDPAARQFSLAEINTRLRAGGIAF